MCSCQIKQVVSYNYFLLQHCKLNNFVYLKVCSIIYTKLGHFVEFIYNSTSFRVFFLLLLNLFKTKFFYFEMKLLS